MKRILGWCLVLAAGGLVGGCASSETGNGQRPTVTVEMAMTAGDTTVDGDLLISDLNGNAVTISTASMQVRSLELRLPDAIPCTNGTTPDGLVCNPDERTIRVDGPWQVDLLAGTWSPALPPLEVAVGGYGHVELLVDSMVVGGTMTVSGTPHSYQLDLLLNDDLIFDGTPTAVAVDTTAMLLLTIDATGWFTNIPLVDCAENGDFPSQGTTLQLAGGGGECDSVEASIKAAVISNGQLEGQLEPDVSE